MPPRARNKPESAPAEEAVEAVENADAVAAPEGSPEPAAEAAEAAEAPAAEPPAAAAAEDPAPGVAAEPEPAAAEPPPVGASLEGVRIRVLFVERKADEARALRDRLTARGALALLVDVTGMPAVEGHARTAYLHPSVVGLADALREELGAARLATYPGLGGDHVSFWVV